MIVARSIEARFAKIAYVSKRNRDLCLDREKPRSALRQDRLCPNCQKSNSSREH